MQRNLQQHGNALTLHGHNLPRAVQQRLRQVREGLGRAELRLQASDPALILQRGYAWLTRENGVPVCSVSQVSTGQGLTATLADGTVDLQVLNSRRN